MRHQPSHVRLASSLAIALALVSGCAADPSTDPAFELANGAIAEDAAVGTPPDAAPGTATDALPAPAEDAATTAATTDTGPSGTGSTGEVDSGAADPIADSVVPSTAADSGVANPVADSGTASPAVDSSVGSPPHADASTTATDAGWASPDSGTSVADTSSTKADTGTSDTGKVAIDSGTTSTADAASADVSVSPTAGWRTANLTEFTSYPDPSSSECIDYNGCTWAGQFAALSGVQPVSWVKANNIAAVHSKDFATYELKTLRLRQGTKQIDVKVYDMCADSDCSGCCTKNSASTGFLIDVESYTAQRFGTSSGVVEWTCLDCK